MKRIKKIGGAFNIWKHGKCKRKGVCFVWDLKKYAASEQVEIMSVSRLCMATKQENGCFDGTILQRKILCAIRKSKVETVALLKEVFQNETWHNLAISRWQRVYWNSACGGRLRTVVTDVNISTVLVVFEEERHSSTWKLVHDLYVPIMLISAF